ncbi:MAG: AAA family ATPase [Planctomycetes bacterium]|nr:AAA family ATPase [Planctomycetota bacterium]
MNLRAYGVEGEVRAGRGSLVVIPVPGRPGRDWLVPLDGPLHPWPGLAAHAEANGSRASAQGEPIPEGSRHTTLTRLAGAARRQGATATEIEVLLAAVNAGRCRPPLPDEEVRNIARSAANYAPPAPVVVRVADVEAVPVRWTWPGRIPAAKLTLLVGDPGLGKSLLTLYFAAVVSRGALWPGREPSEQGAVVILSAEDDVADTIRPRLDAAGADTKVIHALTAIRDGAHERVVCLDRDLPAVEATIERAGRTAPVRLVVIDPISAYLGDVDSHVNAAVRGALAPLAALAQRTGAAVLAVTHLRKAPGQAVYRAMGSLAFTAAARAAWGVARDAKDPEGRRRLLLPIKANLAAAPKGIGFRVVADGAGPRIKWDTDPVTADVEDALGGMPPREGDGEPATTDDDLAGALRRVVSPGSEIEDTPAGWARRLGWTRTPDALGRALSRLTAHPRDGLEVRRVPRGGNRRGWMIRHTPPSKASRASDVSPDDAPPNDASDASDA